MKKIDYKNSAKDARNGYRINLREIILCKQIFDKISPLLPKGWEGYIDGTCFNLHITNGSIWQIPKKGRAGGFQEFKLVCKLVESAIGKKIRDRSGEVDDDKKVDRLKASIYHRKRGLVIGIDIVHRNPEQLPDCEITFKRRWTKEAILSSECLGMKPESDLLSP